jgi:hypothetical protein
MMPRLSRAPRLAVVVALLSGIGLSCGPLTLAQSALRQTDLDRIARETAEVRGLPALGSIDDVFLSKDELMTMMPNLVGEETDRAEAAAQSRSLAALGLIPAGTDLFDLSVRLMDEQAAGFYDPLTDKMFVLAGDDTAAEEYFYSHEVVHALQDADLDPNDLMENPPTGNSDAGLAELALYEGDAVATSNDYLAKHPALALAILKEPQSDFPELEQAPGASVVDLVFPYASGLSFVERLRAAGGWERVNAAYADMPVSTEQILHPEKYLERDVPSTMALPDPQTALGAGWQTIDEDTLGELQIGALLADLKSGGGFDTRTGQLALPETAHNAAAGWDGDRYALWSDGTRDALVWRSVWDTPEDARAFSRALAAFGQHRWGSEYQGESLDDIALVTSEVAARIQLDGQEVRYVQAPDRAMADETLTALRTAQAPNPAPGPN